MTKCASEKQRLANRKNARKSTGPRTVRGKARSARNALKHGLLAKDVVLHGPDATEHQAAFDALLADPSGSRIWPFGNWQSTIGNWQLAIGNRASATTWHPKNGFLPNEPI